MKAGVIYRRQWSLVWLLGFLALLIGVFSYSRARAFTLNVVGSDGGNVGSYRWLVEEATPPVNPGDIVSNSLAVSIHRSHTPVVAAGHSSDPGGFPNLDPSKNYFVSVLPDSNYTIGGSALVGNGSVIVTVNSQPVPTAQISVFVFEDDRAISGIPDIPAERGLAGFNVKIFDAAGQVMTDAFGNMLDGLVTDADGRVLIKNLAPGKYDVEASPTDGQPWIQTVSIGGGPKLPAVVKAGEPSFLPQGGILNMHVFIGFIKPFRENVLLPASGANTITGRVVNVHSAEPPDARLYPGNPVKDCYVALNLVEAGTETGVLTQACNQDSTFSILNVPDGTYQLVMWDAHLSNVMSIRTVTVPDPVSGTTLNMGDIPIARWVGTLQGSVFLDSNGDGSRQDGEPGLSQQAINLRSRDGSIYQAIVTDIHGNYELSQIAVLGPWLIAEVDFARLKATGATSVADLGGPLGPLPIFPFDPVNAPSAPDMETGPVLTKGVIVRADQVDVIDWSKEPYGTDENGGISGIVFYATTRAEDAPAFAAGEGWEPGVPRVQVNLYEDYNDDKVIDDVSGDGAVTLADVDNYPFGWMDGGAKGNEDIDRNNDGAFDRGDAIEITYTDSFDDNLPTGCIGDPQTVHGMAVQDCAETMQTWNQVRPALFDGGYAFGPEIDCLGGVCPAYVNQSAGDPNVGYLKPGLYIVEAVPPPGYVTVKEEDRNVDFGDEYSPTPALLPKVCVGDDHLVPNEFSLFPLLDDTGANVSPYRAGELTPLCNRKQVPVNPGQNAASDFFIYTEVPKAGQIVGKVINPFANQANPNDPNFGGPLAPSWMPVSIQDFNGNEITRVYTDEWGAYSALLPSTYSVHVPMPSGVAPNVVYVCSNYPSSDPRHNPNFDQPCISVEIFPGKTTYALNPVGAIAGFTASDTPTNCDFPAGTPVIDQVNGPDGGPYVSAAGQTITLTSMGAGPPDYGFGATLGTVTVGGLPLNIAAGDWTSATITATVPAGVSTGQLIVTRADGVSSEVGVTLHVGGPAPIRVPSNYPTIQAAINAASAGDLILVAPGSYDENLIMWKPVKLQGYGAYSTIINAANFSANKADWLTLFNDTIASGAVTLVNGQRADLAQEQGAGITVLAKDAAPTVGFGFDATGRPNARIDGFTIEGASWGSGIFVNGYARALEISNNRLQNNQGTLGGAIRAGWQSLVNPDSILTDNPGYYSAFNDHLSIHHNQIVKNGSSGNGGAIGLFNGSDNYAVTDNFICGNYTAVNGAAIAHHGLSNPGLIANNTIVFNEAFGEGGGILIGGEFLPAGATSGSLAQGAGSVTVVSNLIQGNLVGDDGGGISIFSSSGQDVLGPDPYVFNFLNNMIVNNVSGFSGAGIALSDTVNVNILHNTIAHNDNLATEAAFAGGALTETTPMVSGIVSRGNSPGLTAATGQNFVNPVLDNNIIWHNRSWFWRVTDTAPLGELVPDATSPYWDFQVFGVPGASLNPRSCILSDLIDSHSGDDHSGNNNTAPPDAGFVNAYLNTVSASPAANALLNFPTFEPRTLTGDYHILDASPAVSAGDGTLDTGLSYLATDYDMEPRPIGGAYDVGADELVTGPLDSVAPTIVAAPVTDAAAGRVYYYPVKAVDPNADQLVFSLDTAPADMTIGGSTGVIQWQTPVIGDHSVTVRVSDAALSTTQTFTIAVGEVGPGPGPGPGPEPSPAGAGPHVQCPGDLDGDSIPDPLLPDGSSNPDFDPNIKCMHVTGGDGYAVMADGRPMYIFGFSDVTGIPENQVMEAGMLAAAWPAPTITVDEGNELYLTLTNAGMLGRPDLFDPHTIHWHGFPHASAIFDGVPDASIAINMAASLTYYYNVVEPGTYMWHCHVEATEHMQMGMLGNLYVRPAQNQLPAETDLRGFMHQDGFKYVYNDGDGSTYYDVEYPVQIGSFDPEFHDASGSVQPLPFAMMRDKYFMLNGRGYPDTINPNPLPAPAENGGKVSQRVSSLIEATRGQKILLRISNLNTTQFNTLGILGITMRVVGKDAKLLRSSAGANLYYETNSVTLGGGESVDVILDTANVPPGTYFLYSRNLNLLCNNEEDFGGMMTEIVIH